MSQLEVSMTLLRAAVDQTCELVELELEDNIENVSVKAEKNLRQEKPNTQRFLLEKFQMKAKCITQDISISKAVYRKINQRLEKLHCETRNISEKIIQSKQAAFKFNMFVEIFKSLNSTELEVFRMSVAIEILAVRQRSIENLEKPTVGLNSRTKTQPEKLVVKQSNVTSSQPIFSSTITDERRLPSSLGRPLFSPPLGDELQSTKQKTVNASSKIPGSVSRQLELDHRVVTYLEAVRRKCVAGNLQNPPDFTEDKPAQFELECGIPGMFWLAFPSPGREALQRLIQRLVGKKYFGPVNSCEISVGSPVVARFTEDGQFYRAKVEETDGRVFSVRYLDYGNQDCSLPASELLAWRSVLEMVPPQATPCCLYACPERLLEATCLSEQEAAVFTRLGRQYHLQVVKANRLSPSVAFLSGSSQLVPELSVQLQDSAHTDLLTRLSLEPEFSDYFQPAALQSARPPAGKLCRVNLASRSDRPGRPVRPHQRRNAAGSPVSAAATQRSLKLVQSWLKSSTGGCFPVPDTALHRPFTDPAFSDPDPAGDKSDCSRSAGAHSTGTSVPTVPVEEEMDEKLPTNLSKAEQIVGKNKDKVENTPGDSSKKKVMCHASGEGSHVQVFKSVAQVSPPPTATLPSIECSAMDGEANSMQVEATSAQSGSQLEGFSDWDPLDFRAHSPHTPEDHLQPRKINYVPG